MTGATAAPALVFRRRSTMERLSLAGAPELGAGGEARVVAVPGDPSLVAKLYHAPTMERARKVALMIDEPPALADAHAALAWPCDLLIDARGRFAGFLMPRVEGPRLFELYNPITRRKSGRLCDSALLHRAGSHLAAVFDALHARGYVVGDVNESNVILGAGGTVTLVDTDSLQVRDPDDGTVHRSRVGKPEFTPPELQGKSFADFDRTPEHDRFGLGVLLFLALMEGTHPFAGRTDVRSETPPVEERIRRGLFPHHGHPEIHPPKLAPPFAVLDPALRALFVRCFADGHADPGARPAAAEWRDALTAAEAAMKTCGVNPRHRFGPHLDACPWCERTALLHGRDPFPVDPAKVAGDAAPPRKPAALPALAAPPVASATSGLVPPPGLVVPQPVRPPVPASAVVASRPAAPSPFPQEIKEKESPLGCGLIVAFGLFWWGVSSGTPLLALIGIIVGGVSLIGAMVRTVDYGSAAAPKQAVPGTGLPRLPSGVPGTWRLALSDVQSPPVDLGPFLANPDEIAHALAGHDPPPGVHPPDWLVRVAVHVQENGAVDPASVRVDQCSHPGPAADAAARAAARVRFNPLTRGWRRVAPWVWLDFSFEQS